MESLSRAYQQARLCLPATFPWIAAIVATELL